MVGGSSGKCPATARTPSVPKSFFFTTPLLFLGRRLDRAPCPARSWTVTLALVREETNRSSGRGRMMSASKTVDSERPVTSTGAVVAASEARTRLSGPWTATLAGSISVRATRKPRAGLPRSVGWTSSVASAVLSSLIVTLLGEILTTSAPGGTAIMEVLSGYSCCRTVARSRSIAATSPEGPISLRRRLGARSVTSIVVTGCSTISSPAGTLRVSSGMVRDFSEQHLFRRDEKEPEAEGQDERDELQRPIPGDPAGQRASHRSLR